MDVIRGSLAGFHGRVGKDVRELVSEVCGEPVAENGPLWALGADKGFVRCVSGVRERIVQDLGTLNRLS